MVYNATGGKHWTPKHVGLASTLHQATRSKELVQLFHRAGHIISYDSILQVDTALAEETLKSMDNETGAVVPRNFVHGRFVHFTCDNIDINDTSFDGKNSFHATQMAGWQRGPESNMGLATIVPTRNGTLAVPEIMNEVFPADIVEGRAEPVSLTDVERDWYSTSTESTPSVLKGMASDMAFHVTRQEEGNQTGWTNFNQMNSVVAPEMTSVGYMPIIQAPAHEMDTLNTVVKRCRHVANVLGQSHVVLTVDEALFCKLMELKWAKPEYQNFLIVRLGGLHTAMNFLKAIGKHIQSSGLPDAWIESKLLGPKTAEQVLAGKSYARGIRTHKLTLQAMWRILIPRLLLHINESNPELSRQIRLLNTDQDVTALITTLDSQEFRDTMDLFVASDTNVNFKYWWSYMQMVTVLLLFNRAQRDGIREMHLHAFKSMLPIFMRYDHTNYARWGTIYLSEMNQLPAEVQSEFNNGNFVVKRSKLRFNQVDPDQSQEWLNATGKKGGGITGITKTPSALSRWALSYNFRAHIAADTREMYRLGLDDTMVHNEGTKGRQTRDDQDEKALLTTLTSFNLFTNEGEELQNIATKDLATAEITNDLLNVTEKGQTQLMRFVEERLQPCNRRIVKFRDPLQKNNAKTFAALYGAEKKQPCSKKEKVLKADRSVLQRLVTAYEAGRKVNLNEILCHELLPVPIAIAEVSGELRTGDKSILCQVLTENIQCEASLGHSDLGDNSSLIIDGQALVVAIGKPHGHSNFGELSDTFRNAVFQAGTAFNRTEVVFDRYYKLSVKAGTRNRRAHGNKGIRRVIENREVPLPSNWNNFMALSENKEDLARFLSEELMANAPLQKTLIVAGGFSEEERVESSDNRVDTSVLAAHHDEADTRLIVHCKANFAESIVVQARDTDILVLLLTHFHHMPCDKLWLKAGTAKKRKYIPIHTIIEHIPVGQTTLDCLPAFHALTGCDTTSYFSHHSKKTAWKVFWNTMNC